MKLFLVALSLSLLSACGGGGGGGSDTEGDRDRTAPTVSTTNPAANATGIAVNTAISAGFSEALSTSSVSAASFTLSNGTNSVAGMVSYNGTTATFTPSAGLNYSTTYTATITTSVEDEAGNALATPYTWSFTTGTAADTTAPTVSATNPANNAGGAAVNSALSVTFSEVLNASTVNTSTFTLRNGTNSVAGTVSYSGTTATFTPSSNLAYSTVYTATVSSAVTDAAGNALASPYTWSFTTGAAPDTIAPTVSATSPTNNATGVAINSALTATFSEVLNASSVSTASFTLNDGTKNVAGTVSYSGTTATFTPASNLAYSTTYTATLSTGVKDAAGNALVAPYTWSFTTLADTIPPTVSTTSPVNNAIGVAINGAITAGFSETLNPATLTASTFTLNDGINNVAGTVSYSGTTATFTPSSNLAFSTAYTATLSTGVKDAAGNALAAPYTWSFTTVPDTIPPTVTTVSPANTTTGVAINSAITATFNEAMTASSINTGTFILSNGVTGAVSFNGTTATFTPASNLAFSTTYTATISGVKDALGNTLTAPYSWSFTTVPDTIPPTVTTVTPADTTTGVALNTALRVTFSETMKAASINTGTFTLNDGLNNVTGILRNYGTYFTFTPSTGLAYSTTYTATLSTGVQDAAGNALAAPYTWSFTTLADTIPPTVSVVSPVNTTTGVAINTPVTAGFSEALNPATLNASTFTLSDGINNVAGTVSYNGTTATFTPTSNLAYFTTYTATLSTGVQDTAGNGLAAPSIWSFTTEVAPDTIPPTVAVTNPAIGATDIAVDTSITATFSEVLDAATINGSSFTLNDGTNNVAGTVSYSGTTAVFTPASSLANATVYTATITGVQDVAGNAMATPYTWSFTTAAIGTPTLALFAGNLDGRGSVDGLGQIARFSGPQNLTTDSAGNIYVADTNNHTIRKITPAGMVTTLAGTVGMPGSVDGVGAAARFRNPNGIAVDSAGNIYVADTGNYKIRKITPAGAVTTLAGAGTSGGGSSVDGTGTAATFSSPQGLAIDGAGNLYAADSYDNTVRKITPAGVVTTFAGTPGTWGTVDGIGAAARFYRPEGIATDSAGNVYVADTSNHTIRKITPAGEVTTLAGRAGRTGTTDGIGSAARFYLPRGLVTDSAGNLYVAGGSYYNNIRKITPAGAVTTLAGRAGVRGNVDGSAVTATFGAPYGVALDSGGNLYVADAGNSTIRKISSTGQVSTLAGMAGFAGSADGSGAAAGFSMPQGITTDTAGNVYVADYGNSKIRKITPTGVVTTLAGSGIAGSADGTGTAASFKNPFGVATDSAGNVYVADTSNNIIRSISPAGVVTTLAGTAGVTGSVDGTGAAASFNYPIGIATDSLGNVYVSERINNTIRKITPAGVVTTLAGGAGIRGYVDGTGTAARFNLPWHIATDSLDNLYVVDYNNNRIRKITPAGVVTTVAGTGAWGSADGSGTAASFLFPRGIVVDSMDNLYVTDSSNHTIRKITPAGVVSTVVGAVGQAGFVAGALPGVINTPVGVAVSGSSLYITSSNGVAVVRNVP